MSRIGILRAVVPSLVMVGAAGLAFAAGPQAHPGVTSAGSTPSAALPAALRPALYRALARDAGPAYGIAKDGCSTLHKQRLEACFGADGERFVGAGANVLALRLAAWGRGAAVQPVGAARPAISGNRARYSHGGIAEWWRVLPIGFEQGFTIARRPRGNGKLTLVLAASGKATVDHGAIAFGKLRYGHLVVTDARGKVVPSKLTAKDGRILIAVNDAGAHYPLDVDPLVWTTQEVTASDGVQGDEFGVAVALQGATAFVGAPDAAINGNSEQGAVYVFTKSNGTWSQTQKLTAGDGIGGFGYSMVIDGTTALIGAPYTTVHGNTTQGAAYVFTESGGTWSQVQQLVAADGASYDEFGYSVALDGTNAVIGAIFADSYYGAAYIFTDSGGTWNQEAKLSAGDGASSDGFGTAVAISGTTALVSAPNHTVGGNVQQGVTYVFTDSGGAWSQQQELTAGDGAAYAYFGIPIVLDGATAFIGAPDAAVNGTDYAGAVYVFTESGGTYSQQQELTASDASYFANFGTSISVDGTSALISAPTATVGSNQYQGEAYLFSYAGGTWSETQTIVAQDGQMGDEFGYSVGLSGTAMLLGALGSSNYQGAAYFRDAACPQGYSEQDGSLNAGGLFGTPPYQAPAGVENGILGGPSGFQLYAKYSNGGTPHVFRIPGNEVHRQAPAGTYQWGVKAGATGGDYVLCVLHP